MGKAYANRKKIEDRPNGDFYYTPKSLVLAAENIITSNFKGVILEPCAGQINFPIWEVLYANWGMSVVKNDLYDYQTGLDYLSSDNDFSNYDQIITNPPFSLWNNFIFKAKKHCKKFMFIGRLNYLSTQSRLKLGLWNNLKAIYPFSRYVDYRTPYREDGLFHVGAMATAWFLWDMEYSGKPVFENVLDVQKWAKLGQFKESE